jgi:hypothetical protein
VHYSKYEFEAVYPAVLVGVPRYSPSLVPGFLRLDLLKLLLALWWRNNSVTTVVTKALKVVTTV